MPQNYRIQNLLDIPKLQGLLDSLYVAAGLPLAIIDLDGNIITGSGWQDICTKFHRVNPQTELDCLATNKIIINGLSLQGDHSQITCPRGLIETATPLIIEGVHLANVFTGQFFITPPDREQFRHQAREFGFDEEAYLVAFDQVPVISQARLDQYLSFIVNLTEFLALQGLTEQRTLEAQHILRESEERLGMVLEAARAGTWDWDIVNNRHHWDKEFRRLFDIDVSVEAGFEAWEKCIHPDDLDGATKRIQDAIVRREDLTNEYRVVLRDGEILWIRAVGKTFYSDDIPVRMLGLCLDITANKQAEEALTTSEDRHRTLLLTAMDGFWMADMQGRLLEVSETYCRMSGYSAQELLAMRISDLEADETDDDTAVHIQGAMVQGKDRFESRHRRKDGTIFEVEVSSQYRPIEGGRFLVFLRDITESKQADVALRRSEKSLKEAQRIAGMGNWELDLTSNKLLWSDEIYALFEINPNEFDAFSETFLEAVHPEDREAVSLAYSESLKNKKSYEIVHRLLMKDGRVKHVQERCETFYDSKGRPLYSVGTVQDITYRKQEEEARAKLQNQLNQAQKMEAIGTLAGGIAHDFNNILGVILGYSEMAREDAPPGSRLAKDLDKVLTSAHRAKDLVKQILAFSRQSIVDRIPMKIQPLVKESLKMLRASIPSTITIQENIQPQCGVILADPTQVHQIVMNLGTNAFQAMEKSGGVLSVEVKTTAIDSPTPLHGGQIPPGNYVELTVHDTGTGIEPDIIEKIFDPYFTTKEIGKGTGMGLSISDGIIKGYGGDITVESTLGQGTTFHVYFPLIQEKAKESAELPEAPKGKARILFIDDEELLAEMSKDMLQRLGYSVTVHNRSIEALAAFMDDPDQFDLVITDQTMPGMTGTDLARRLLQIRPDVPIILCTGFSQLIDEDSAKAIGIREFALKPLTKPLIGQLIQKILNREPEFDPKCA